jgi:hypothetical protein
MGALRLLAESYTPEELNGKAWALYAQFRPEANEWGKRSEVSCDKILALRKKRAESPLAEAKDLAPTVSGLEGSKEFSSDNKSPRKKARLLEEEIEREAALNPSDPEPDFGDR